MDDARVSKAEQCAAPTKKAISEERRAVLFANLEKARIARREQAALNKETRDAEREVLKRRQEARLAELKKEKQALSQQMEPETEAGSEKEEEAATATTTKTKVATKPTAQRKLPVAPARRPPEPPPARGQTKPRASPSASAAAAPQRRKKAAIVEESDNSSSCSSESEDAEEQPPRPPALWSYPGAESSRKPSRGGRSINVPSSAIADELRQRAFDAAFASLFPTWQLTH